MERDRLERLDQAYNIFNSLQILATVIGICAAFAVWGTLYMICLFGQAMTVSGAEEIPGSQAGQNHPGWHRELPLFCGSQPPHAGAGQKSGRPAAFGCAVEAGQDLVPLRHEHFGAGDHAVHRGVDTEFTEIKKDEGAHKTARFMGHIRGYNMGQ